MENNLFKRSANRLEAHLGKDSHEFTKEDIKQAISDLNIRMVNFMYPAGDGRLLQQVVISTSCHVSLQRLSILSLRFQHSVCSALSSTEMVIR